LKFGRRNAAGDSPEDDVFSIFFRSRKNGSMSHSSRNRQSNVGGARYGRARAGGVGAGHVRVGRILLGAGLIALVAVPGTRVVQSVVMAHSDVDVDTSVLDLTLTDAQKLSQGVQQYNNKQYEEAVATLQTVLPDNLDDQQKKQLSDTLAAASAAAASRKAARAEFQLGEQALNANDPSGAMVHYRKVLDNPYADDGTRAKAQEQIALATAAAQKGPGSAAATPAAVPGPGAQANAPANGPTTLPNAATATPPGNAPAIAAADARTAYYLGRDQYRKGDWISARRNLEIARDGGFSPGLFEDSPQTILSRMDAKEQADDQQHRAELAAANVQPATATNPAATPIANPLAATGTTTGTTEPSTAPAEAEAMPATEPAAVTATPGAQQELARTAEADRLRQSQLTFESNQKVQEADEARQANRLDDALNLYTQAVTLNPSNTAAVNGRNAVLRQLGLVPGATNALDRQQAQIEARREAVMYSFNGALDAVHKAVDTKDFQAARANLEQARVARGLDPNLFNEQENRDFDSRLAAADLSIGTAQAHEEEIAAQQRSQQTAQQLAQSEEQRKAQTQRAIASLISNSQALIEQGNYEAALGVVKQILTLDPTNDYARGVQPLIEDRANIAQERKYREAMTLQLTKTLVQAEEEKIPYSDILDFPEDWPELSTRRDQTVAAERGEEAADEQIFASLDKRVPELRFDSNAFSDVIDYLRDVTATNIYVNWRALEAAGIDKTTAVSIRLRDVKFSKALRTILDDVGGSNVKLGYTIDDGVITISTADDLAKNTNTRVYDIRDLIIDVPDFTNAPPFDLSQVTQVSSGGGGGQSLFSGNSTGTGQNTGPTRADLVESIIKLIQDTVASDSWKDNGGAIGSIRELQGQLIVTQTPENQRALVGLLEKLREQRAIQVTVEARFLVVQRNFLEDIGVNLNMEFNTNSTGTGFGPISITNSSGTFTAPGNLNTGLPGTIALDPSFANNLTTGFTYLDDFEVNLLIRATEDTITSTQVTAPRLTLFNGERAWVVVETGQAYVSNLTPVVSTGAVAFAPTAAVIPSGVELDVQATVSADRKYVTLVLRPTLSRLIDIVNFPVSAAAAGAFTTVTGETSGTTIQSFIQQPEQQVTQLQTTVSVPDGGTLLLGGQTLSAELTREAGVPVLSKIPFLKRLFTNRSTAKDDQVLLILVKPTIIIEREKEAEQFPLLTAH
jgi:general secretion pathway protein D